MLSGQVDMLTSSIPLETTQVVWARNRPAESQVKGSEVASRTSEFRCTSSSGGRPGTLLGMIPTRSGWQPQFPPASFPSEIGKAPGCSTTTMSPVRCPLVPVLSVHGPRLVSSP